MNQKSKKVKPISDKELAVFREAIVMRFGTELEPGETIIANVSRSKNESVFAIVLENIDKSFRLDLEAAVLEKDNKDFNAKDRVYRALDFVENQLGLFFEDRTFRFHDDWRIYDFLDSVIRFRGQQTNPDLESQADDWLKRAVENENKKTNANEEG